MQLQLLAASQLLFNTFFLTFSLDILSRLIFSR